MRYILEIKNRSFSRKLRLLGNPANKPFYYFWGNWGVHWLQLCWPDILHSRKPPPAQRALSSMSYSTHLQNTSGSFRPHQWEQVAHHFRSEGTLFVCILLRSSFVVTVNNRLFSVRKKYINMNVRKREHSLNQSEKSEKRGIKNGSGQFFSIWSHDYNSTWFGQYQSLKQ